MNFRIGFGYDVHQLVEGRKLIIGGVEIPFEKGFLGHSDADVLLHAICDSIIGALALGDIGKFFPDTDQSFKNIDSSILLERTFLLAKERGYRVNNLDCVILLQKPKITPFINQMKSKIANILETSSENISIKATTNEKMGFVGREEGAAAYATILLIKD